MAYRNTLLQNNVHVDSVNGNDVSAVKYNILHSYKTINAAKLAANSGDVIIVLPGNYTENVNLYKDGITYYFYPEAIVTAASAGPIFTSLIPSETCKVYGKGCFLNNGSGGVARMNISSTLYMEFDDLAGSSNPIQIGDGFMQLIGDNISSVNNAAVNFIDSTISGNSLYIKANNIYNLTANGFNHVINILTRGAGYKGTVKIYANEIIGSPNSGNSAIALSNQNAVLETLIQITANKISGSGIGGNPIVDCFDGRNTKYIVNANVVATASRPAFRTFTTQTGIECICNGNMDAVDVPAISLSGAGEVMRFNGKIISNSVAQTVLSSGSTSKVYLNGTIINTADGAVGITKGSAAPSNEIIISNLKIVTFAGLSISAAGGDTVKVVHSLSANNDSSPVMPTINSINPAGVANRSVAYFDAGVE